MIYLAFDLLFVENEQHNYQKYFQNTEIYFHGQLTQYNDSFPRENRYCIWFDDAKLMYLQNSIEYDTFDLLNF